MVNNPIMWVDPSGLIIQLVGTNEDKEELLSLMWGLTNLNLAFDNSGVVYIAEGATISNAWKIEGNTLIYELIMHDRTVTIQFTEEGSGSFALHSDIGAFMVNGRPGVGSDASIFLDRSQATTADPLKIILGHEMIHAHRFMTGTDVGFGVTSTIRVGGQRVTAEREELIVIGLIQPRRRSHRPITTENKLRRENNIALRQIH